MITDMNIEKRCRYRLARHGLRVHKMEGIREPIYYAYEVGGDDSPPDPETGHYMSLWNLLELAEYLAEKEAEYKAESGRPWKT